MLQQLRSRKVMKRVMIITMFLVVPSFIAFYGWTAGRGGRGEQSAEWFARYRAPRWYGSAWEYVKAAPNEGELNAAKDELRRRLVSALYMQQRLNDETNADRLIRQLTDSARDVATEAVDLRMLDQMADELHIRIGAEELRRSVIEPALREALEQNPELAQAYKGKEAVLWRLMTARQGGEEAVLAQEARRLTRSHVRDFLTDEAFPSLRDIWNRYKVYREELTAEWTQFPVDEYEAQITPTEAQLAAFFEAHAADYAFPDRREYSFVLVDRDLLESQLDITTQSVRDYYDAHAAEFVEPASVVARAILLAPPSEDDVTTRGVEIHEIKIQTVQLLLAEPDADFAAVADSYSEAPDKKPGGLLDEPISERAPSPYGPQVDQAALALKEGETTGPIRTFQGTVFIHADKVTPQRQRAFEECAVEAMRATHDKLMEARMEAEQARFAEESKRQTTMQGLADAMGVPLAQGVIANRDSVDIPGLPYPLYDEVETLGDLDRDDPRTPVIATRHFLVVLKLEREIPARAAQLDEVTTTVREHVIRLEAAKLAQQAAEAFAEQVRQPGADFAALARELPVADSYTTGSFTRSQPLLGMIENFDLLTQDLTTGTVRVDLSVSPEPKVAGKPWPMSYVVWKTERIESPTREEFFEQLGQLIAQPMMDEQITIIDDQMAIVSEWQADKRRATRFELNSFIR